MVAKVSVANEEVANQCRIVNIAVEVVSAYLVALVGTSGIVAWEKGAVEVEGEWVGFVGAWWWVLFGWVWSVLVLL